MIAAHTKTKIAKTTKLALAEVLEGHFPKLRQKRASLLYCVRKHNIALPRINILEPLISFLMIAHTRAEDARRDYRLKSRARSYVSAG
jgi:hypothetical protein